MHVAGVQDGAWPDSNVPFGALRLWDSGTQWSAVEAVKGKYDWTLLDRAVANAESHKIKDILLVLGSTPTWNAKRVTAGDYPVPGAASPPKSVAPWDAFVRAVAKRYKGRITSYQVWNEASLTMFWNGTPELMADLTKRASDIIHEVDPKATVVAASTTVRLDGAFNRFFPRYLAALAELDWPVDVFAAHLYPTSRGSTDDRADYIQQVVDVLDEAGAPELPIWDTELNYGLAGPGPENPLQKITGSKARDWVVETAFDSLAPGALPHLLVHLDAGALPTAGTAADKRLRCGEGLARRRSVDRRCHDPGVHRRRFGHHVPDRQAGGAVADRLGGRR